MRVSLRYFAVLRERRGTGEEVLDLVPGTTVSQAYADLFPPGADGGLPVLFAVNREYVSRDHRLQEGDELAFIPPLGGG